MKKSFELVARLGKGTSGGDIVYKLKSANHVEYILQIWQKTNYARLTNCKTLKVSWEGMPTNLNIVEKVTQMVAI
jgi:hypothetical protein